MSLTLESSPGSLENPHVGETMRSWAICGSSICGASTLRGSWHLKKVGGCLDKEGHDPAVGASTYRRHGFVASRF